MLTYHTHQVIEMAVGNQATPLLTGPQPQLPTLLPFTKQNGQRYVRFSLSLPGEYTLTVEGKPQLFVVQQYQGANPLYQHGGIQLSQDRLFFEYADGLPFFWLADTWWYGLTDRADAPTFKKLLNQRTTQGFSVAMVVVGSPPEIELNSDQAGSHQQLPWTADFEPNPAYFDAIDIKIEEMVEAGLVPCIVGAWGPQIDRVGEAKMITWWQTILARYAPYPVAFCLTGEVDLPTSLSTISQSRSAITFVKKYLPQPIKRTIKRWLGALSQPVADRITSWNRVGEVVMSQNQYQRPLMIHPHTPADAMSIMHHPRWLHINSIQSGHSLESRSQMVEQSVSNSQNSLFLNLEPWYEGILGNFGAQHQRYAFWMSVLAGAKGHTYGADGLWNMRSTKDRFLGHWGAQSWPEALSLPGAQQLGMAADWLKQQSWWKLRPSLTTIQPAWSPNSLDHPLTATIEATRFVSYFPVFPADQYRCQLTGQWRGTWYQASNLRVLSHFELESTHLPLPPNQPSQTDCVLVLEKY